MNIGEVRNVLEKNYDEHYKKVIELDNASRESAIKYIQEQTSCEYEIAEQIAHEWTNKSNIKYVSNTIEKSTLEKNVEQIAQDIRFFKILTIICLIIGCVYLFVCFIEALGMQIYGIIRW